MLTDEVLKHFEKMGRVWPSVEDALLFIATELAEATELVLAEKPYVRNHAKEPFSPGRFAEELGDIIYMCVIAGQTRGVDPVEAMLAKMFRQVEKKLAVDLRDVAHADEEDECPCGCGGDIERCVYAAICPRCGKKFAGYGYARRDQLCVVCQQPEEVIHEGHEGHEE